MCHFRTLRILRNPHWWCKSASDRAGFLRTMRPAYTRHRKFRLKNNNLQFDRNKCPIESQPILKRTCHFRRLHTPRNPCWWCRSGMASEGFRLHLLRHRCYHRHRRRRPQAQFLRQQSKPLRYRCLFSRRCLNLPRLEHKSPKIIHRLVCKIDQPLNRWSARTRLLCKHCLTGFLNY